MPKFVMGLMLLFVFLAPANAQSPKQDSLRLASERYEQDTTALQALIRLAQSYFGSNLDSSLSIGERARRAALAPGNEEFLAQAENTLGIAHLFQGKNRESLANFEEVLRIRETQGDKRLTARALNNVALAQQELGNMVQALDCQIRSLKLKEELGDSASIRISYNNIGLIYEQIADLPMARHYYRKALNFQPIQQDTLAHATNLFNIGATYFSEGKNDSALVCFNESAPLVQRLGDQRMIGVHELHFGMIAQREGDFAGARQRIERSLDIFRELGKLDQVAAALASLGSNHLATGEPRTALNLCKEGLQLARDTENKGREADCLECLHRSCAALSLPAEAYAYAIEFQRLTDSLRQDDAHQQIVRKDLEYSFAKTQLADSMATARSNALIRMDYENRIQSQQTITIFLIVVGSLLLGLAILFYANLRNRKRQGAVLEERVKLRTAELEQQRDRLAEYAFINAHLLRQPLTQVMGLITLIQMAKTEEERDEYLKLLETTSQKLDGVIHEIRDVVEGTVS